jgi:ketosteroid isomerase-like protein
MQIPELAPTRPAPATPIPASRFDGSAGPRVIGPQAGKFVDLQSVGIRFMIWGAETGGPFSLVEHPIPPHSTETPRQGLEAVVEGINTRNYQLLMSLYEPKAAFATQPGSLAHGLGNIREALGGFVALNGKLDLEVSRVLEVGDLALVVGKWSFAGTGPDGEPVKLAAKNADVLRRQADGSWRFVIDNPWGTD